MKRICIAVLTVFLLACGAYAQSPGGPGGQGERRGGRMGRGPMSVDDQVKLLTGKLQLTDDQQTKVKAILEDQHQQSEALRKDESVSREDRMTKFRALREASDSKIRELLTDDQKKAFDQWQQERRERRRERSEKGTTPTT
jgi:protein CpxP